MRALGLALVSAAVLLLQLVQTRVFSVMLWHHLTYLVVTFTLLGFAAGGTALACRPAWLAGDVGRRLALGALLFGLTVLGAYMVMTRVPPQTGYTSLSIATAAVHYALLLVPMIFGGFVVALALADAGANVGRTYAINMVGSAFGCLLYVPALRKLGGEGCVELSAARKKNVACGNFSRRSRRNAFTYSPVGRCLGVSDTSISPSALEIIEGSPSTRLMPLTGTPMLSVMVSSSPAGTIARTRSSTAPKRRCVSSTRVAGGART